ncbi:MAG: hypothetical protein G01um10142_518 [Parcubacteria group bacterium Gr01-1014_2]|nr:MAG: hypothetical protein G01um10142_518 [Parcubacteria group bacterium Gr01-1014_2]
MEGSMFDPEALEAAKKFLFGPQPESVPSISASKEKNRSVDPIDTSLGLGGKRRDKLAFRGAAQLPHNPKPRLVKHNFAKP